MEGIGEFFIKLVSPELQSHLLWLRIIFYFLTVYFIFGIFYFGRRGNYFKDRRRRMIFWREYTEEFSASQRHEKEWAEIEQLLKSEISADQKRAVIAAGKLFEKVLKAAGSGTGDFETRVRRIILEPEFEFDQLIGTHRLWQSLVDNPQHPLTRLQAKEALAVYHRALERLKYF